MTVDYQPSIAVLQKAYQVQQATLAWARKELIDYEKGLAACRADILTREAAVASIAATLVELGGEIPALDRGESPPSDVEAAA